MDETFLFDDPDIFLSVLVKYSFESSYRRGSIIDGFNLTCWLYKEFLESATFGHILHTF